MMRKLFPLMVMLVVLAGSGAFGAVTPDRYTTVWYMGNCDPTMPNSAGPGMRWILRSPNAVPGYGSLVYDNDAFDKLAWRVYDNEDSGRMWYRSAPGIEVDHILGATVVARVKTIWATPGPAGQRCGNLGILDPSAAVWNSCIYHWGGPNNEIWETTRGQSVAAPPGKANDQYHILRMTMKNREYFDASPYQPPTWVEGFASYALDAALSGQGPWFGGTPGGYSGFPPELVSGLTVVADPDNAANQCLAFVGGDLVFANSALVLVAPRATGPDAGKMSVTIKLKRVMTSGTTYFVHVDDINNVNIAQWYGGANSCRPRIASGGTVGSGRLLTGGGVWDTLKIVIDTVNKRALFYLNDVVDPGFPNGLDYTLGNPNRVVDVIGRIRIDSPWNFQGRNTLYIDDISFDGDVYAPVIESPRTIKLYLDENPTPVMTISPAPPAVEDDPEGFGFGTTGAAGQQEIWFDWVTATNQGAFAPGEEVVPLGKSLIPGTSTPVATIDACKTVPDGSSVIINSAIANRAYKNDDGTPWFFGIEKPDRTAGIRVISNADVSYMDPTDQGKEVKLMGAVTTQGGERVLYAGSVEVLGEGATLPDPLSMNNLASGGGAFGMQPAVMDYGDWDQLAIEAFAYSDGALVGNGGWTGNAGATRLAVSSGAARIYQDPATSTDGSASKSITPAASGPYKVMWKQRRGVSTAAGFIWRFFVNDTAGTEIASFYGSWNSAVTRIGSAVGPVTVFNDDNWHTMAIEVTSTAINFYVDGSVVDSRAYTGTQRPGSISMNSLGRGDTGPGYMSFDDITFENARWSVGFLKRTASGPNNVGMLVKLFGKVTDRYIDTRDPNKPAGSHATNYFYIDDGSGLLGPGPPSKGVKCADARVALMGDWQWADPGYMPNVGDYVSVYGLMGVQNNERYLYTWSFDTFQYAP